MTQEDKVLLLKDLCGRLPYWVKCRDQYGDYINVNIYNAHIEHLVDQILSGVVQMVLRPMSSMTEEERKEYTSLCNRQDIDTPTWSKIIWHDTYKSIDWLNKKMFDYRKDDEGKTMIEKGLALEAPEGIYE